MLIELFNETFNLHCLVHYLTVFGSPYLYEINFVRLPLRDNDAGLEDRVQGLDAVRWVNDAEAKL